MTRDQQRKLFENWAKSEGVDITRHSTGFYIVRSTQMLWKCWQARGDYINEVFNAVIEGM